MTTTIGNITASKMHAMVEPEIILEWEQMEDLLDYVEGQIGENGCDHSHRFAIQWAKDHGFDADNLCDALDMVGGFCDCEVVLNYPDEFSLELPPPDECTDPENPWLISPKFGPDLKRVYEQAIYAVHDPEHRSHATDDELLLPAPKGAKPRKRMGRFRHFFVGFETGEPCHFGQVRALSEGATAGQFAELVKSSPCPELRDYSVREAAYYLNRAANQKPGDFVGVDFRQVTGIASKRIELNIHKVM
jgi:hypothetical protein